MQSQGESKGARKHREYFSSSYVSIPCIEARRSRLEDVPIEVFTVAGSITQRQMADACLLLEQAS